MLGHMKFAIAFSLSAAALFSPARAEGIPQYVKGPISGLIYDCQENKQTAPKEEAYVTRADFDGDGKPDYIIDTARGCASNRALYCNTGGCSIDIYVSSLEMLAGSFKAQSFKITKSAKADTLILNKRGAECGPAKDAICSEARVFNGEELVIAPAAR